MTVVVDASFLVAALVDSGPNGVWAEGVSESDGLAAPHLVFAETANILRRSAAAGLIGADVASLAHADLMDLPLDLFGYEPFGSRIWSLRNNVTCYDAWYVALAEILDAPLATLDIKLSRSVGPTCRFLLPPDLRPPAD